MKTLKKKNLINEQNKSLFIIACVLIGIIAFVSIVMLVSGGNNTNDNSSIREDGVVNDIEAMRK